MKKILGKFKEIGEKIKSWLEYFVAPFILWKSFRE